MTFEKVRYLWKFKDFEFPQYRYEYEPTQDLRRPTLPLADAGYAVDLLAGARPIPDVGKEGVRFVLFGDPEDVNLDLDTMRSSLFNAGVDWVWTRTDDEYDTPRKALAYLESMPAYVVAGNSFKETAVSLSFIRLSEWIEDVPITASKTVTANSDTLDVFNYGNLKSRRVTIRITANTNAGFSNVRVVNTENDQEFESSRDSALTGDILELDTRVPEITFNGDNDFSNYVLPPSTQKVFQFELETGNNTLDITCDGTPNFDIEIEADASYA